MVTPDTALSAELELDAGFRAAKDWFFANEVEREESDLALARKMARLLRIRPQVLYGKTCYAQERLQTVEKLAAAEGWSDEMLKFELRRARRFAVEELRQLPWVERAINAAQRDRALPGRVMAALPAALSAVKKDHPNNEPQKGTVVHELQQLLASEHGGRVSKARIARALPADFASRD